MSQVGPAQNNLEANLFLNKVMNGQITTATGRTVTAASQGMAANLNNAGYSLGSAAPGVAGAMGLVTAAQSSIAAMREKLNQISASAAEITTATSASGQAALAKLITELTTLETSKVGTQDLFGAAGLVVNGGFGDDITVLNSGAVLATGGSALLSAGTLVDDLDGSGTALKLFQTAIDTALAQLTNQDVRLTEEFTTLKDRHTLLGIMGKDLSDSTNQIYTSVGGGATGLANSVLGG